MKIKHWHWASGTGYVRVRGIVFRGVRKCAVCRCYVGKFCGLYLKPTKHYKERNIIQNKRFSRLAKELKQLRG